jgi:hypothetical protein
MVEVNYTLTKLDQSQVQSSTWVACLNDKSVFTTNVLAFEKVSACGQRYRRSPLSGEVPAVCYVRPAPPQFLIGCTTRVLSANPLPACNYYPGREVFGAAAVRLRSYTGRRQLSDQNPLGNACVCGAATVVAV